MITNINSLEKYCTDYKNIDNYEEAVKSPLRYDLHHRREISEKKSRKQLIADHLYFDRPPEELIFIEHREHMRLHKANLSDETKQKISESKKGNQCALGHHCSEDTKQKISESLKGKHWHLENGRRIYTD